MLPALQTQPQATGSRVHHWLASAALLAMAAIWAIPAQAQDLGTRPGETPPDFDGKRPLGSTQGLPIDEAVNPQPKPEPTPFVSLRSVPEGPIGFEADTVEYNYKSEIVTVTGNVVMRRQEQSVRADRVIWDRNTGKIEATGNIRLVDENGNQLFTDRVELTDELKAGMMENLLIALREGGRIAAIKGERDAQGRIRLTKAAYTGCPVEDGKGCPKNPTWQVNAEEVTYDPAKNNLRFRGARLRIFGITLMPLPGLSLATDGRAISGTLIPDLRLSTANGVEISEGYYQRLGDNQDMQVKGYVFTKAAPMISGQYRALTDIGAFQITGYATRSSVIPVSGTGTTESTQLRGYIFANGKFQFDPNWSLTASLRLSSDRTFLRRYDISRDDRLRSTFDLERIDTDSYFSFSGWTTQTLRVGDRQGLVPIALPVIDYRRRLADPVLGGNLQLQLNSLAITRTSGQDTQRAFAGVQWDLTRLTPWGQLVTFTALARGDVYHSSDNLTTTTASYRGLPGWQARGVAIAAIDVKWPLVGPFGGGTQVFTPRLQLVASPPVKNLAVPNEDSRAIDLEDSNLFALNRFPGYDRVEDGVRLTYGFDWQWQRPNWRILTTIGQSYRFSAKPTLFPDGTGLNGKVSDIVGRTEIRYKDFLKITHRYRLDKDTFAIRRNEFDATIGSQKTYIEVGYLRLNRNITTVEDLQDREELRFSARAAFAGHWSVFGSGVINLTDRNEDPLNTSNGFQPLRTRVGVAYEDECLELALTWRRDYVTTGDAVKGNTFQIYFALRNLGFR